MRDLDFDGVNENRLRTGAGDTQALRCLQAEVVGERLERLVHLGAHGGQGLDLRCADEGHKEDGGFHGAVAQSPRCPSPGSSSGGGADANMQSADRPAGGAGLTLKKGTPEPS